MEPLPGAAQRGIQQGGELEESWQPRSCPDLPRRALAEEEVLLVYPYEVVAVMTTRARSIMVRKKSLMI